jgi:Uma2 family endonuclease
MTAFAIKENRKKITTISEMLVYEELNGRKMYRKGYRNVINQTKTIEEIMGCSSLQAAIVSVLLSYLYRNIEDEGYEIMTNEAGLQVSLGNNLSSDIILYNSEDFLKYRLDEHYFNVAPKMVIEVDIKIELEDEMSPLEYWTKKTKTLFSFGVEKVVWVFSEDKKIIIAEPNKDFNIYDWTKDFEFMPNHILNIQKMIDKKGYLF